VCLFVFLVFFNKADTINYIVQSRSKLSALFRVARKINFDNWWSVIHFREHMFT